MVSQFPSSKERSEDSDLMSENVDNSDQWEGGSAYEAGASATNDKGTFAAPLYSFISGFIYYLTGFTPLKKWRVWVWEYMEKKNY